jgi:purine-binding chemotaxis protein CheW
LEEKIENTAFNDSTMEGKYLTFIVGNETYGIGIRYVTEIVGIEAITEVPEMPDYIKGIINLRGKIIPVMDVRLRFNKIPREYDDRTCIIVVFCCGILIGLIVDSVSEVLSLPSEDIVELPKINTAIQNRYIQNIGKIGRYVVLLVNAEQLLSEEELESLAEAV